MDKPQDQPGQSNPTNAGRTPQQNANPAGSAARKPAPTASAQPTPAADTPSQTTASTDASRQSEGQPASSQEGSFLDTTLESSKKWIEDTGALDKVNQLPQDLKNLGNRALDKVNGLSTTQKVVGGAILAAGIGWLATRKGGKSTDSGSPYNYGRQRDAGYGRPNYGYQAPDASNSRRSTGRSDSGAPYAANSSKRYGNDAGPSASSSNTGIKSGSGRSDSGSSYGSASARTDHGAQRSSDFGASSDE